MSWFHLLFGASGRSSRSEFWLHQVLVIALLIGGFILLIFVAEAIGVFSKTALAPSPADGTTTGKPPTSPAALAFLAVLGIGYLAGIYSSIAIAVRRLHDRGKSGWWLLLMTLLSVVVIGSIWYVIELGFLEGQKGANKYGEDPLAKWRRGTLAQAL